MVEWETVEVPRGSYIGWGNKTGQHVTGKVVDYSVDGGTDFNGARCPHIGIELAEKADSYTKDGDRSEHPAGELVQLNAGQVSLKRALRQADPQPGDLIKITFSGTFKTTTGTGKEFDIKIARGAGGDGGTPDEAPPF